MRIASTLLLGLILLATTQAHAESARPYPSDECLCNDDCWAAGDVCVLGSSGVRVCCPTDYWDTCPADPGEGILCTPPSTIDAGPPPPFDASVEPRRDAGPPVSRDASISREAGVMPPPSDHARYGCSTSPVSSSGASWAFAVGSVVLVVCGARRRRRMLDT